ncbi:MAG: HNH endonuclease [Proteobacteria bacterium]|nr:HNH endonuclease [Pseudomonadota bacterium]
MTKLVQRFYEIAPSLENYWRAIILFGKNTASYKFALAKSLYDIKSSNELIKLSDLAVLFSKHLTEHLSHSKKQGTFRNSRFLNFCLAFNKKEISQTELVEQTVKLGFQNVIDAFHNVHGNEIPHRFFVDERKSHGGIRLTDDYFRLRELENYSDLVSETEARWRLVETAWNLKIPSKLLKIDYNLENRILEAAPVSSARVAVTSARDALNGYQKGKCFYCYKDIIINDGDFDSVDVDHFFPHKLKGCAEGKPIDGVANLVLSCRECNRGKFGKFDRIPSLNLLERLHRRNEYLIQSHHPLRETIIMQTGFTEKERVAFLQDVYNCASVTVTSKWQPKSCGPPTF